MPRPPHSGWPAALLLAAILLPGAASAAEPPAEPPYFQPADSHLPRNAFGASVRRGRAILLATRDSLPKNVGNQLRCTSCHLDEGTRRSSGPWVGVLSSFPQYNKRAAREIQIEDRVNECFRRSLNGKYLPVDGRDMRDIVNYLRFLSTGVPAGTRASWLGLKKLPLLPSDAKRGRVIFERECVRCHQRNGEGLGAYPPLWGRHSFAIGAGMARVQTAAAFIRWNMPFDKPGTLSDQEAFDVAAFVLSHSRPDTKGKERDWPNGDAPEDCPYRTLAGRTPGP